jgi:hypothetical protein
MCVCRWGESSEIAATTNLESLRRLHKRIITFIIISGVRLSPLGTAATTGLLYQPRMIDDDDCGAIGGMRFGRGNRSTRRKPTPAPLCQPQILHDQTRTRIRAAAVGSRRLTAWAMARPCMNVTNALVLCLGVACLLRKYWQRLYVNTCEVR